jgi:hypothetical protein
MSSDGSGSGSYERYITMAAAAVMLVRTVVSELLPYEVGDLLRAAARGVRARVSSRHTVVIDEAEGLSANQLYDAARTYLAARVTPDVPRLRASRVDDAQGITVGMEQGEEMVDAHDGVDYTWTLVVSRDAAASRAAGAGRDKAGRPEARSFEVSFHRRHKDKALESYLPHVVATARAIKDRQRSLKMHMVEYDAWTAVDLRHPSTFDTLAMDDKLKSSVIEDLQRFVRRKDYYRRIGRAWKRGYLLYGPPGTGKSSLVAAMANFLKFDIYDLELTEVKSNSDLRRLLVGTSNRSILVVEDIDCSIELQQRDEGERRGTRPTASAGEENDDKVSMMLLFHFHPPVRIIYIATNYLQRFI